MNESAISFGDRASVSIGALLGEQGGGLYLGLGEKGEI